MRRRALLGAGCAVLSAPRLARGASAGEVDLLLVLAADISHSMQENELQMQREGYAAALRHREVVAAMASGPVGAIALTYMEWSGTEDQRLLVPWMRIGDEADAELFAARLLAAPQRVGSWTSISAAITAARALYAGAPFRSERHVLDISGDGENNSGPPVELARDAALAEGLVINGLPILRTPVRFTATGMPEESPLERHYRGFVIGGPASFLVPARGFGDFPGALRRKLVLEIAGLDAGAMRA